MTVLPEVANPLVLVDAMLAAGFVRRGGREGLYVRLSWPDSDRGTLLVPLDQSKGDFAPLMAGLWLELAEHIVQGNAASAVIVALNQLRRAPAPRDLVTEALRRVEVLELLAEGPEVGIRHEPYCTERDRAVDGHEIECRCWCHGRQGIEEKT